MDSPTVAEQTAALRKILGDRNKLAAEAAELRSQVQDLTADVNRMRPVVDAADNFVFATERPDILDRTVAQQVLVKAIKKLWEQRQ